MCYSGAQWGRRVGTGVFAWIELAEKARGSGEGRAPLGEVRGWSPRAEAGVGGSWVGDSGSMSFCVYTGSSEVPVEGWMAAWRPPWFLWSSPDGGEACHEAGRPAFGGVTGVGVPGSEKGLLVPVPASV
jgi:hypothetical protein